MFPVQRRLTARRVPPLFFFNLSAAAISFPALFIECVHTLLFNDDGMKPGGRNFMSRSACRKNRGSSDRASQAVCLNSCHSPYND